MLCVWFFFVFFFDDLKRKKYATCLFRKKRTHRVINFYYVSLVGSVTTYDYHIKLLKRKNLFLFVLAKIGRT